MLPEEMIVASWVLCGRQHTNFPRERRHVELYIYQCTYRDSISSRRFEREQVMSRMIFVNLPVRDLAKSLGFYVALDGKPNAQFSDDAAKSVMVNSTVAVATSTTKRLPSSDGDPT